MNLPRKLRMSVIVAWCLFVSGDMRDVNDSDSQDHMDHVGEFTLSVCETCLSCDSNIFIVALQTKTLTTPFLFVWNLLIWNGSKSVHTCILLRSNSERSVGRTFKNLTSEKGKASAKVVYRTRLGTTGMDMANGYKKALVVVEFHLPHHGCGDQSTGECILLKKKIAQDDFCSVQFFCEFTSFYTRWYILLLVGIIPLLCIYFVLSVWVQIYTLAHRDNIAFVSTYFPPSRSFLKRTNRTPTPNFCPLSAWMSDFGDPNFIGWFLCFGQLFSHLTWISESCDSTFGEDFFTPVEHFAVIDRASRILSRKIIRESAVFQVDVSLGIFVALKSASAPFLQSNHCATSASFCRLANV